MERKYIPIYYIYIKKGSYAFAILPSNNEKAEISSFFFSTYKKT